MARVVYNGRGASKVQCSNPDRLKRGCVYEVLSKKEYKNQTNLILKGIEGEFCKDWFVKPEYFAVSNEMPTIGQEAILTLVGNTEQIKTSIIEDVLKVGNLVYKVFTENSIYFVQIQGH